MERDMKVLIIDGSPESCQTPKIAAMYASRAILAGKSVEYRELEDVQAPVEKHLGLVNNGKFYEKLKDSLMPEIAGFWWFREWELEDNNIFSPKAPVPVMKSIKRGKLHILLNGEQIRANEVKSRQLTQI